MSLMNKRNIALTCSSFFFLTGCIVHVPQNAPQGASAQQALSPEIVQAYNEIPAARAKGERNIADDGIPLPQQIKEIDAYLSNKTLPPGTLDTELTKQIEAQMKLKQLQKDVDDMDSMLDIDL